MKKTAGKDRGDLEKLTVTALRDLARKEIGVGYSKLRTKAQLVEALVRRTVDDVRRTVEEVSAVAAELKETAKAVGKTAVARRSPAGPPPASGATPHAPAVPVAPLGGAVLMTALPVDSTTLFVRWNADAARGVGAEAGFELEVTADGHPARLLELPPGARNAYVRALPPSGLYRAVLFTRGHNGTRRMLAQAKRPVVMLPRAPVEGRRPRRRSGGGFGAAGLEPSSPEAMKQASPSGASAGEATAGVDPRLAQPSGPRSGSFGWVGGSSSGSSSSWATSPRGAFGR